MIKIIKELNIDVTKPNIFQALVAKQYDMNTRFLKVTFTDCGNKIEIPLAATNKVIINAERKDGQSKGFDGVINDDGTVTVPLHSWMLELDGSVICDISVVDTASNDNKRLTTTSFTLLVEKAAYGGNDVTSDPQYDVIVSLLETCSQAGELAKEALEKSNEANSKYDACVRATEAANEAAKKAIKVWVGTTEEYNTLKANGQIIPNCMYIKTDDNVLDWIVEQGTDGIWTYRKWASGIVECWGKEYVTCTTEDAWIMKKDTDFVSLYTEIATDASGNKTGNAKVFTVDLPECLIEVVHSNVDLCAWGKFAKAFKTACLDDTNFTEAPTEVADKLAYLVGTFGYYNVPHTFVAHYHIIGRWKEVE